VQSSTKTSGESEGAQSSFDQQRRVENNKVVIESILFKKDYGFSRRINELAALTWTFVQNVLKYNKDVRELLPDNRERLLWINTCSSDKRRGTQRDREQDL
jgi:hypothetical protein